MTTWMVSIATARGVVMIHRRDCHMAKRGRAKAWPPGDTRHPQQLSVDAARLGFRPCRVCRPFPPPDPRKVPGYQPPAPVNVGAAEPQIGFV